MQAATPKTTFDALPAKSRIWVFASARALDAGEQAVLTQTMDTVMQKWVIKQPDIRGCWEIHEDRFLLVGSDETNIGLDGCSVDAMMSWLMRLERETGLKFIDRTTVHYRDGESAIRSVSRPEFARLFALGEVTGDTMVFDTTIHRVEALRTGLFEIPMCESWHWQAFGS